MFVVSCYIKYLLFGKIYVLCFGTKYGRGLYIAAGFAIDIFMEEI